MSFKVIRQKDSMQCGVACLAMICRHFGAEYSLDFLMILFVIRKNITTFAKPQRQVDYQ
ncbi:MAG: hypothetical protein K2H59_10090 [Muribaculaceae bacterium]|nr:hypothetical protein [Muribaculaceae bacterium]